MTQADDMDRFLATVEKRAYSVARISVGNSEDALDIVQDAMFALVRRYAAKPEEQWQPLFFRILYNRINDHHRRHASQRRWFSWWPGGGEQEEAQSWESLVADGPTADPAFQTAMDGSIDALEHAVAGLPQRQQEAFLLRSVQGLNVAETAAAMRCSEGSVKTHYSRANKALREQLEDHWT
ncbi:MAG: RNA polymerase sigma factor [Pseudomonadales bacterium]